LFVTPAFRHRFFILILRIFKEPEGPQDILKSPKDLQDILRILKALRLGLGLELRKLKDPEDILKSPQDPRVLQAHILERKLN